MEDRKKSSPEKRPRHSAEPSPLPDAASVQHAQSPLTERLIRELRNYQLELESTNNRLKEIAQEKTRIADSLALSESRYRALVESTDDFIYRVNREGEYLFMNTRTRLFHGLSPEAVAGRHYGEFHDEAGTAVFMDRVRQVFDQGISIRQEHSRQGRHYLRTLSPVKEADGSVMSVTVVSKEITDQKRLLADLESRNEALRQEQARRSLLSKRLIDLLEEERRRIAGDLHDQVGQRLTSLKLNLEQVSSEILGPNASLCQKIDEAIQKAAHVLHDIKHISRQLRPPILDTFGLAQSLVQLLTDLEKEGVKTHFFQKGVPVRFDPEKEMAFYRIAQEATQNILKHAQASVIHMNLVAEGKNVSLSVEDDGVGFNPGKLNAFVGEKSPLGLLIMRERACQLGGELTVESASGRGTHILAEIPLA